MAIFFTDKKIVNSILAGGKELNRAMSYIFNNGKYMSIVRAYILENGGIEKDAEDIFQDGIAHLIMNIRKGHFRGDSSLKTYFAKICKNLWLQKQRRAGKLQVIKQELSLTEQAKQTPESILLFHERSHLLNDILQKMGSPCREIIGLWSLSYSMKEIAARTNYKNEGVVRKKKHQCFQKLFQWAKENDGIMKELRNT